MGDVPVVITIRAPSGRKEKAFHVMDDAFQLAREIENEVSEFVPSSDTFHLNSVKIKEEVFIRPHLLKILLLAEQVSLRTEGAFDVTFASRNRAASFRDLQINQDRSTVLIDRRGIKIGVSGIAKGYIVDRMSEFLNENGFSSHLVNAGGDLMAHGVWRIGIRDPLSDRILCSLDLQDQAASTSGLYERGRHLFDPRLKGPIENPDFLSVTVIGDTCFDTDPLSTAGFMVGRRGVERLISRFFGVSLIVVDQKGRVDSYPTIGLCR
ncbi:MAG: FAD:protein FMN transferase [Deltaproteobacteria bacterium]|nr:FAD:protein FMN transferase [Deltaproteobacteria bacterium]